MAVIVVRISQFGDVLRSMAFDQDTVRIGRDQRSDVFLPNPRVSRLHAKLEREGDRFFVNDNGSRNGTRLNDKEVDWAELETGDCVQVGGFTLWVEVLATQVIDAALLDALAHRPTIPVNRRSGP